MAERFPVERLLAGLVLFATCLVLGGIAGLDPKMAIAASLAIAFVIVAIASLTAGLALFTVVIFLQALVPVSAIKLAGLLLALSWLATLAISRRDRANLFFSAHPGASYVAVAFIGWVALGVAWADNSGDVLTDASRFLLDFVLLVIVYTAARNRTRFAWVLGAFIAGVALAAMYGIVARAPDAAYANRLQSAVGNPNELAAVLLAGLTLAAGVALAFKGSALRIPAALVAVLAIAALILTGSRGGVIALAVTLIAAVALAGRWRARAVALAAMLVLSAVMVFALLTPRDVQEHLLSATPGELNTTQEARGTIWQVGLQMAGDNLLTGVGSGNFDESSIDYLLTPGAARSDQIVDKAQSAHNMYLQILSEQGILGLGLFLAILGFALLCSLRAAREFGRAGDLRMEIISRAVLVATIGVIAASFFSSHQFEKWLWILLAFGPVLLALARQSAAPDEEAEGGRASQAGGSRIVRPPALLPESAG